MRIKIDRKWKKETYTIGRLYVNGEFFCHTLEDKDRDLSRNDSLDKIRTTKVYGETAIPRGTYAVAMNVVSPKYSASKWYMEVCQGKVPRVVGVPGFEGVLIHTGNTALDTFGCILVGNNTKKGQVTSSKDTFRALYKKMKEAINNGETITLEIV